MQKNTLNNINNVCNKRFLLLACLFIYLFVIHCFAAFTECNNLPNLLQNALRVNVNFFPTSNHFTVESLNQRKITHCGKKNCI